jgi:hypothetical protein
LPRSFAAVESWAAGAKLGVIAEMIRRNDATTRRRPRTGTQTLPSLTSFRAEVRRTSTAGPVPGTTKRSIMSSVNGVVPTTIIVVGLALAGYALLMTALNRRVGFGLLAVLGVLEILLLVLIGLVVARLAGGGRPASLPTLIGYLIAMPFVLVVAAFWGAMERSRWGPAVYAAAGLVAAVLMVRLHEIWPVIHV